jgi:Tfp pilus assembly protein PilF
VPFVVDQSVGPFRITRQLGVGGRATVLEMCRLLGGDLDEGRAECELALRLDAQVPEGHFCRGLYLARTGDTEGARREFEMVVETAPDFLAEPVRRQLDRLD